MDWTPVEVLDEDGNGLRFQKKGEAVMPLIFKGDIRFKQIEELPYKKDDVIICSYPKTGTHWAYNLVHHLRFNGPMDQLVTVEPNLIELEPEERWETASNNQIKSTHLKPERLPSAFLKNGGKVILVVRNPKDACVSFYHHLTKFKSSVMKIGGTLSWNRYFDAWINGEIVYGTYVDFYNAWQKEIEDNTFLNILVVHFEKLKQDGLIEMQRIQDFLGLHHPTEYLQAILDKCTVENMREDVQSGKTQSGLKDNQGQSLAYRKGEIGDWKTYFTVAQNECFNRIVEDKLFKDSPFKL